MLELDIIRVRFLIVVMKKTLKLIRTEYANFTFLSDEQKRKNYSSMSLHGTSRLLLDRRGYATNKKPYNEEMRIIYINIVDPIVMMIIIIIIIRLRTGGKQLGFDSLISGLVLI
jgi:hypothetical protein